MVSFIIYELKYYKFYNALVSNCNFFGRGNWGTDLD
jgi:hypothetical protein